MGRGIESIKGVIWVLDFDIANIKFSPKLGLGVDTLWERETLSKQYAIDATNRLIISTDPRTTQETKATSVRFALKKAATAISTG
jgi:hypothetical protein